MESKYQVQIQLRPENVGKIIKDTCIPHNYLQQTSSSVASLENHHTETRGSTVLAMRLSNKRTIIVRPLYDSQPCFFVYCTKFCMGGIKI